MWMANNGISIAEDVDKDITYYEERGQTVVLAAINGNYVTFTQKFAYFKTAAQLNGFSSSKLLGNEKRVIERFTCIFRHSMWNCGDG